MKVKVILAVSVIVVIAIYTLYVSISSEKVNVLKRSIKKDYFGTDTVVTVYDEGNFVAQFRIPNGKITTPVSEAGYQNGYWFCNSKEYGMVQSNMRYIASDKPIVSK